LSYLLVNAQEIEVPDFQLSEISFPLKIENLSDSVLHSVTIIDADSNIVNEYSFEGTSFKQDVTLHNSGSFKKITACCTRYTIHYLPLKRNALKKLKR